MERISSSLSRNCPPWIYSLQVILIILVAAAILLVIVDRMALGEKFTQAYQGKDNRISASPMAESDRVKARL